MNDEKRRQQAGFVTRYLGVIKAQCLPKYPFPTEVRGGGKEEFVLVEKSLVG